MTNPVKSKAGNCGVTNYSSDNFAFKGNSELHTPQSSASLMLTYEEKFNQQVKHPSLNVLRGVHLLSGNTR